MYPAGDEQTHVVEGWTGRLCEAYGRRLLLPRLRQDRDRRGQPCGPTAPALLPSVPVEERSYLERQAHQVSPIPLMHGADPGSERRQFVVRRELHRSVVYHKQALHDNKEAPASWRNAGGLNCGTELRKPYASKLSKRHIDMHSYRRITLPSPTGSHSRTFE